MKDIEIKTYSMTNAIKEKEAKKEKKTKSTNGLRKGAYSVIFAYIALVTYLNPFSLDFIPYGLALNKLFLIPESVYIIIIMGLLSLIFSLLGTAISIFRTSILGFLLSFLIFGNVSYLSAKAYSLYQENPVLIDNMVKEFKVSDVLSTISFVKKSDINNNEVK